MANLPNIVEVPCKVSADPTIITNIANAAGRQFAFSNMMPVACKVGPLLTLTTYYNLVVAQTAQPMPNFGNTGSGSTPTGPQRWPLKL